MNSFLKLCESYYQANNRPMKINVSGNIGSGKSTFCEKFVQRHPSIYIIKEPVHIMRSYYDKKTGVYKNLLDEFYQGKIGGVEFQNLMIEILMEYNEEEYNKACAIPHIRTVLFDRSVIDTIEMFSRLISMEFYNEVAESTIDEIVEKNIYPDLFIFIRSNGEKCKSRINMRGRPEEMEIDVKYLLDLEEALGEFEKKVLLMRQTVISVDIDTECLNQNEVYDKILDGFDERFASLI